MKNSILVFLFLNISICLNAQYAEIAMNSVNGGFWLLGADKKITSVNEELSGWTAYPGNGSGFHLRAYRGSPLLVGMDNGFYSGNGQGWQALQGGGKGQLIVADGQNGKYWCIGTDNTIYALNGQQWTDYTGNEHLKDLAVYNNVLYAIGITDAKIYKSISAGRWEQMASGTGKRITIDAKTGTPWCIGSNDDIFRFDGQKWVLYPGNGKGKEIAVYNDVPYVIANDGSVWKGIGSGWVKVIPLSNYNNVSGNWNISNLKLMMLPDDGGNGMKWTNDLKVGTVFLYQTNGGMYGKFQILENGPEYRLRFTTYSMDDKVFALNGNLNSKDRGGWINFDNSSGASLDQGRHDSADIYWHNHPEQKNVETNTMGIFYLKAMNGARMYRVP